MTSGTSGSAVVAIVGRPNVGKSTLFNRLVGKKLALVDDQPGVTRDRREGEARLMGLGFTIVDTAGLEETGATALAGRMRAQTEMAIAGADVILFVVDARLGLTPLDQPFADMVRRAGKPVILLANKAEGGKGLSGVYEAFGLGLGEPIPVSAEHGEGMVELFDAIKGHVRRAKRAPSPEPEHDGTDIPLEELERRATTGDDDELVDDRPSGPLRVAIIGRPNAGKSTLVNRLVGEDRLLTGPEAGITRDTISLEWNWRGRDIRLHDTAGIRRKSRVEAKLEKLSVADALRAVRFAEVVVVLLDATIPFEKQDLTIIDLVEREGRAVIIGLNKWDLVADQHGLLKTLRDECTRLLPQVRGIGVIPLSGLAGNGVEKLMDGVLKAEETWMKRIPTAALNRWMEGSVQSHTPPAVSGRRIKIRYMTQAKARPPTFVIFGNQLDALPKSYTRYLVNGLRETFALHGTPIRLNLRNSENPYAKKD